MKKVLLFLMAITTVALVGCGNVKENEEVNLDENEEYNQQIEEITDDTNSSEERKLADRETIFDLFDAYIEENANESGDEVSSYRIENVTIIDDETKASLVEAMPDDYKMDDTLATVTFSVKPLKANSSWLAGNGEESGEWIVNKIMVVTLRDGELINIGTGW